MAVILENHEYVGRALHLLRAGLGAFVKSHFQSQYGGSWESELIRATRSDAGPQHGFQARSADELDAQKLLNVVVGAWNTVFQNRLDRDVLTHAHFLRRKRNVWGHQGVIDDDDAQHVMYSTVVVLRHLVAMELRQAEELLQQFKDSRRGAIPDRSAAVPQSPTPAGYATSPQVVTPHVITVSPVVVEPVVVRPVVIHAPSAHREAESTEPEPSDNRQHRDLANDLGEHLSANDHRELAASIRTFPDVGRMLIGASTLTIIAALMFRFFGIPAPQTPSDPSLTPDPVPAPIGTGSLETPPQDAGTVSSTPPKPEPQSPAELERLARLAYEKEDYPAACDLYAKLDAARPNDPGVLQELGRARWAAGRCTEAIMPLEQALKADPGLAVARSILATCAFESGQTEAAMLQMEEAVNAAPDSAFVLLRQSFLLGKAGRLPEAEAAARHAIKVEPTSFRTHRMLAQTLYLANRPTEAVAAMRRAIELRPGDTGMHEIAWVWATKCQDTELPLVVAQQWTKHHPLSAAAHACLGTSQVFAGKGLRPSVAVREAGIRSLRLSLELNPEHIETKYVLLKALFHQGKWDANSRELQALASEIAKARPQLPFSHLVLGVAAITRDQRTQALGYVDRLKSIDTEEARLLRDQLLQAIQQKR